MKSIAFTGAESTGKTTLVNALHEKYPDLVVVTNLTRSVDGYLNKSDDIQKQIMAAYVSKLTSVLCFDNKNFLCDRTLFDVCAYSKVKGVWDDSYIKGVLGMYKHTRIFPEYLFYLPIEFPMVQDGGRPEGTRNQIDAAIKGFLDEHCPMSYDTITGGVEERVQKITTILNN